MLDMRTYTRKELIDIFKTDRLDSIKAKIKRRGYTYTTSGRGDTFTMTITGVPPRFREFCIERLGFAPNTDFERLKVFLYCFFFVDDFRQLPFVTMKECMINNVEITRQTISRWVAKLYDCNWVCDGDLIYYCIDTKEKTYRRIEEAQYNKAWSIYWENRTDDEGYKLQYFIAYNQMWIYLGGHPYKKNDIIFNGFYTKDIEELKEILEKEIGINEQDL